MNEDQGQHETEHQDEGQNPRPHGEGEQRDVTQPQIDPTPETQRATDEARQDSADTSQTDDGGTDDGGETGDDRQLLRGSGRSAAELQIERGSAATRIFGPGDPGYQLRPGDPGYAAPARIAPNTGVLTREHLGYHGGQDPARNVHDQVPLAMPAPAPSTVESDTAYMKPSTLDPNAATMQLRKMAGAMLRWIKDLPHAMSGEDAVIVNFFRDLEARRHAIGTAAALGRTVEKDAVDAATSTPPAEFFELRHAAQQMMGLIDIYDRALGNYGLQLEGRDAEAVTRIKREFGPLAQGPTSPDDVPKPDQDRTEPQQAPDDQALAHV